MGINSNVVVKGEEFHVQTEDLGPKHAQIVSHIFREGGVVVEVVRLDYSRHLNVPNLQSVLTRVMKAHHLKAIRSLQRRRLDSIRPYVTLRPPMSSAPQDPPATLRTEDSTTAGPSSQIHLSLRVKATAPVAAEPRKPTEPPKSAARVWERVVGVATRERQPAHAPPAHETPPASARGWDLAVQSVRQKSSNHQPSSDPAREAYEEGLQALRLGDTTSALTRLALAVQLVPSNSRYRSALRRALDAMVDVE